MQRKLDFLEFRGRRLYRLPEVYGPREIQLSQKIYRSWRLCVRQIPWQSFNPES